jgi:hypothetical protein
LGLWNIRPILPQKSFLVTKVYSGGQTGVDRAALDFAIKHNIVCGGWCPAGRIAEDGNIPKNYPLQETESSDYGERTKKNILDSDGTLVLVPSLPIPNNITDGTLITIQICKEVRKPLFIAAVSDFDSIHEVVTWLKDNNIKIVNIAGPRESQSQGIYSSAIAYLEKLFHKAMH